ncbi:thioredoxin family protein [Rhodopirellula sp. JC639]|uniref:thioredoxin family protein n=1 Tax=Stieleria mannarensis TaxID=2755585 RepID=UPI001600E19E|nr:thioredoxin family protein [Rhodopirellula sp. JC639]
MVRTASTMLPLGTKAPDFSLPECDGGTVSLSDLAGKKALLVMFMCNHCPYVKHVADQLKALSDDYMAKGVAVVAISSNDADEYPDDSPEAMSREKVQRGYGFDYLHDADQSIARAYAAACTPDFFLFDADQKLVYRGQLDSSRPGSEIPVTGEDLRAALDAVLAGQAPSSEQRPSLGCNIKWKSGNEPDYFNAAGTS